MAKNAQLKKSGIRVENKKSSGGESE